MVGIGHIFYREISKFADAVPDYLRHAADEEVHMCSSNLKLPTICVRWLEEISTDEYIKTLRETKTFCVDSKTGMDGCHINYTEDECDIFVVARKGIMTIDRVRHVVRHECRHAWQIFYQPPGYDDQSRIEIDAENYANCY